MKPIAIMFFLISILSCTRSSDNTESSSAGNLNTEIPPNAERLKFADLPEMEMVSIKDELGNLAEQGALLNGKKDGTWTQFYPNGMVKGIISYSQGMKEGIALETNTNGQFSKRTSWHKNFRQGEYREYNYPMIKEERFYQHDKIEGTVKIYYNDGKIMEEGSYKNGIRDGISRWYDNNGAVTIEYDYRNGELVKK